MSLDLSRRALYELVWSRPRVAADNYLERSATTIVSG